MRYLPLIALLLPLACGGSAAEAPKAPDAETPAEDVQDDSDAETPAEDVQGDSGAEDTADRDGDGVNNDVDPCPDQPGDKGGCPPE